MRRQSNPITPHETFSWTVLIQIRSFSGPFIFLHLSTSPRSDFPGSHGVKKTLTNLFCFKHAHYKVLIFFMFSFMAYGNLAKSLKRLESELTNVTRWHFCSLPIFHIEHSFIYFLSSEFFPLFVCFDKLWQLATIYAHDNTRDRDVNTLRQNDVTWCYFLQGKQVDLLLSCSLSPQKT